MDADLSRFFRQGYGVGGEPRSPTPASLSLSLSLSLLGRSGKILKHCSALVQVLIIWACKLQIDTLWRSGSVYNLGGVSTRVYRTLGSFPTSPSASLPETRSTAKGLLLTATRELDFGALGHSAHPCSSALAPALLHLNACSAEWSSRCVFCCSYDLLSYPRPTEPHSKCHTRKCALNRRSHASELWQESCILNSSRLSIKTLSLI